MSNRKLDQEFQWRIENFSACPLQADQTIESPIFKSTLLDESEWRVVFAPRGDGNDQFIGAWLKRSATDPGPTEIRIEIEMCLIDLDKREQFNQSLKCSFKKNTQLGFAYFVERKALFKDRCNLLPRDVLTLHCRLFSEDKKMSTQSLMHTRIDTERSTFCWTIEKFTNGLQPSPFIISSSMCAHGVEITGKLDTPEPQRESGVKLQISIKPQGEILSHMFMSISISVMRDIGVALFLMEEEHAFKAGNADAWNLTSLDDLTKYAKSDGNLDLKCELAITNGRRVSQIEKSVIPLAPLLEGVHLEDSSLPEDIKAIYEEVNQMSPEKHKLVVHHNEMLPDIYLRAGDGKIFLTHKLILSARSLVLRKLLRDADAKKNGGRFLPMPCLASASNDESPRSTEKLDDVTEDSCGISLYVLGGMDVAQVLDTGAHTMKQVVKCMYTDTLDALDLKSAKELLCVADKLQFWLLRDKCEDFLISTIDFKTVYEILIFADFNRAEDLKTKALDFIAKNKELMLLTEEWQVFMETQEELGRSTLQFLRSKRKKSELY